MDPIGLAGGLNLYGYANGDPINFSDPFGLCERPSGLAKGQIGICVEGFIKGSAMGAGDKRGPSSNGGTYKVSARFGVNPADGTMSTCACRVGTTFGVSGDGAVGVGMARASDGSLSIGVSGAARTVMNPLMGNIEFEFSLSVGKDGNVSVSGGGHDGYPSYEVWVYPADGGAAKRIYHYRDQGQSRRLYGGSGEVPAAPQGSKQP